MLAPSCSACPSPLISTSTSAFIFHSSYSLPYSLFLHPVLSSNPAIRIRIPYIPILIYLQHSIFARSPSFSFSHFHPATAPSPFACRPPDARNVITYWIFLRTRFHLLPSSFSFSFSFSFIRLSRKYLHIWKPSSGSGRHFHFRLLRIYLIVLLLILT